MSVKISAFEKDGVPYPTIELKTGGDDKKFGFIFGLSKARLILNNIDEIQRFVEDGMAALAEQDKRQEALRAKLAELKEKNRPVSGKTYQLTGGSKDKCISNGNTWAESEVTK